MTYSRDQLPALWLFMGGYLHQDWRYEHDSTELALEDFLHSEPRHALQIGGELRRVLDSDLNESALRDVLQQLGSFYIPEADGLTTREWLTRLLNLCPERS